MLTQAQVKELFYYDPETGNLIWRSDRGKNKMTGKIAGGLDNYGYLKIGIDGIRYKAHRLIWLYIYGVWPVEDIDHINGVKSDNRLINLREATAAQNGQNMRKPNTRNTSGYLGVTAFRGGWKAQIMVNKKNCYIGCYDTPEAAHEAYLEKKRELHEFNTL